MYYVYVLMNEEAQMYVGFTADLRRRFVEHNRGNNPSTKHHRWRLIYYEAYLNKKDALIRERRLKQRGQAKKALKERIQESLRTGSTELGARLKAPSRLEGR